MLGYKWYHGNVEYELLLVISHPSLRAYRVLKMRESCCEIINPNLPWENLLSIYIYIYLLFIYDPASRRNLAECDYDPGMPKVFGVDLSRLHTSEKTFVSLKKNVLFWIWQTVKKSGLQWHKENRMALSNLSHKFKFAGLVSVSKSVLLFNGYPLLLSFSCLLETGQKSVCICFATYSLYSLFVA